VPVRDIPKELEGFIDRHVLTGTAVPVFKEFQKPLGFAVLACLVVSE
jgi:hypothetical protein